MKIAALDGSWPARLSSKAMRRLIPILLVVLGACGEDETTAGGNGGTSGGASSSSSGGTSGGPTTPGTDEPSTPGGPSSTTPVSYGFRYGINLGHRNGAWGDDKEGALAAQAGARSIRIKLPAAHLKTWGVEIEKGDLASYGSHEMKDHIGFLIGSPTVGDTVAPAGSADWQNEYYVPKSLYEPIFGTDGNINPANTWAQYIYDVVRTYKDSIKVWHIWNEPDWVADWHVVDGWKTKPPSKAELVRFNGSIFDYVRMLRIAKQASQKADPDSLIATGGIGYPPFLDAILRYTDNPTDGTVTEAYPAKGGDYLDVVDFHYYPIFSAKSSDVSVDDFIASKRALEAVLDARGKKIRGWNVSETGAPSATSAEYPTIGSAEYARNYLIKVFISAQANGIGGVDWFILSNGAAEPKTAFDRMGLYGDLAPLTSPDQAVKTDTGRAYSTLQQILGGAGYDADATKALGLPSSARGVAFRKDGKRRVALWAVTGASETAAASVELTTSAGFDVYAWDGTKSSADAVGGKATLGLTGSPVLLVER